MSVTPSAAGAGLLLIVAGIWLLLQTLVGGLPSRIVALAGGSSSSAPNPADLPGTSASSNPTPQAAAGAKKAGIPTGKANTTDPNKPIFIAPSGQPVSAIGGP